MTDFVKVCPQTNLPCLFTAGSGGCGCERGALLPEKVWEWRPIQPVGWLCPRCGAGVAPGVERCPCTTLTATCGTTDSDWPAEAIGAAIRRADEARKNLEAREMLDAIPVGPKIV